MRGLMFVQVAGEVLCSLPARQHVRFPFEDRRTPTHARLQVGTFSKMSTCIDALMSFASIRGQASGTERRMAQGSLVHRGPGEHSDWHAWRVSLLLYERAYCRFPIGSCSDQFVKFFEHRPKPKIRSARLKAPGIPRLSVRPVI